jgi:hypothetical protein
MMIPKSGLDHVESLFGEQFTGLEGCITSASKSDLDCVKSLFDEQFSHGSDCDFLITMINFYHTGKRDLNLRTTRLPAGLYL